MDTTTNDASAILVWPIITEDLKQRLLSDLKENCRPPNSWIIYRKEASRGLPAEDSQDIGPISTFISYHWRNNLSKETKHEWGQLAHWLQTMHKQWFPSYKFSPKSKEQKAEIKRERKLQSKSNKTLGPVSVGASSRPQPYTNRPSTRTKRHCPSHSSASSLDSIPTPPIFLHELGPSVPPPVSFPLMGQHPFASNANDFSSYGFRPPFNESYGFMPSMRAASNPTIPAPNPQPTFDYMHGALQAYPQAKQNACFNISPAAYQDVGNWANANDIPFNGQVDSTFNSALGMVPDRAAYELWGNRLDVIQRIMPKSPLAANQPGPPFLQQDPVWTQQPLTHQPTSVDTPVWPTWDSADS